VSSLLCFFMTSYVITGGIGCGKSSLCEKLRFHLESRTAWFSADDSAHAALDKSETVEIISRLFGGEYYEMIEGRRRINRRRLREMVFHEADARKKLESIVHPLVLHDLEAQRAKARADDSELFLAELPLHYEARHAVEADLIIVVASSRTMQTRRLMERRGLDHAIIESILRSQWPIEAKVEKADIVIWNDGDISALEAQALTLAGQFSLA